MNQVNPAGQPTVYTDNNAFFPFFGRNVNEDSQFLFNTNQIVPSAPASQEGPDILQATFAFADPQGFSVPFVQLVLPDAATGQLNYRGDVLVGQSGQGLSVRVTGGIYDLPDVAPIVDDVSGVTTTLGDVISLTPIDIAPGTPPVVWSGLVGPTYTPGFGALPDAPGLGPATWSWNPATQAFQFNTLGSTRGTYVWTGSASNALGSDNFLISIDVLREPDTNIPEPTPLVGLFCRTFE